MGYKKFLFAGLLLALLFTAGCGSKEETEDSPGVEILTLDQDCRQKPVSDKEKCCSRECSSYCSEKGYEVDEVKTFTTNCGCWCSP